jgi:Glycosidases
MSNVSFESPAQLRDVWAKNFWERRERAGEDFEHVRGRIEEFSRDNARTPMQWSDEPNAGFSDSEPWIDVADDYETVNVAAQRGAERSVLEYYRELIQLRDEDDVITYGDFELLAPEHEQVYAIQRSLQSADYALLIICNFAAESLTFEVPVSPDLVEDVTVALGNEPDPALPPTLELRPYESAIYRLHD